jgi:integrase
MKGRPIMSSIASDPNGRKRIQFLGLDGSRKTIRLGKASMKQAEAFKVKVDQLLSSKITGILDDETARWIAGLTDRVCDKLASVGLVPHRQSMSLGPFLDAYVQDRRDTKPATRVNYGHTVRNLKEFFGEAKAIREIHEGDAEQWRLNLVGQGLSDNTVRKRCGNAKQFFRSAVKRKLISANPFAELKSAVQANKKRDYSVTREETKKVLAACPDSQWRLLFALSRYAGLRCPSEHLALRWSDVDWEKNRICVQSPKTEHHPGGESRWIPLFPELRPYLERVFDDAEPGTEFVITRYRESNINLRTQLVRIIHKAGLKPWPKLFQNLRATRETELAEQWPEHVACAWIGNSRMVARKHYLQVTEEHFEQAALSGAAQKAAQQPAEMPRNASQVDPATNKETPVLQGFATQCGVVPFCSVGDTGLEPVTPAL